MCSWKSPGILVVEFGVSSISVHPFDLNYSFHFGSDSGDGIHSVTPMRMSELPVYSPSIEWSTVVDSVQNRLAREDSCLHCWE